MFLICKNLRIECSLFLKTCVPFNEGSFVPCLVEIGQVYRQMDGHMDNRRSEKLTWAFSQGELKNTYWSAIIWVNGWIWLNVSYVDCDAIERASLWAYYHSVRVFRIHCDGTRKWCNNLQNVYNYQIEQLTTKGSWALMLKKQFQAIIKTEQFSDWFKVIIISPWKGVWPFIWTILGHSYCRETGLGFGSKLSIFLQNLFWT